MEIVRCSPTPRVTALALFLILLLCRSSFSQTVPIVPPVGDELGANTIGGICCRVPDTPSETTSGAPGSFVYDGGQTAGPDGGVVNFPTGSGDWKTVTTSYGQFRLQTLADRWPDNYSSYKGYERVGVDDTVNLASLPPLSRVARTSAPSVVEVVGDRCLRRLSNAPSDGKKGQWQMATSPSAGFFVSDRIVLTEAAAIKQIVGNPAGGWGDPPYPVSPESCAELRAASPEDEFEEGAGPFIHLFDGRWASGTVTASNDAVVLIELERVTSDKDLLVSEWETWDPSSAPKALPLAPDGVTSGTVLTIHHPDKSRSIGGWHLTTGPVVDCDQLQAKHPTNIPGGTWFALDVHTESGSYGAPVLNAEGFVVGVVIDGTRPDDWICESEKYRGKNNLGILSSFLADPPYLSSALSVDEIRLLVASATSDLSITPPTENPSWPGAPANLASANYQVIDWGDDFTESGFPVSELSTEAFDVATQATVMFSRLSGCPSCDEALRTDDFNVNCICTGVALTNHLIATNAPCVPGLSLGAESTFQTYYGQIVNAQLVGKSSIDGVSYRGDPLKGDVALLRTTQRMDLTPVELADSAQLQEFDPVITVGHPAVMLRSGPFVTSVGSAIGRNSGYEGEAFYRLPSAPGASGSAVFNLEGKVLGIIGQGQLAYVAERDVLVEPKYGKSALEIDTNDLKIDLPPSPFGLSDKVAIWRGYTSMGAPSNYIRTLIDNWAPGEID